MNLSKVSSVLKSFYDESKVFIDAINEVAKSESNMVKYDFKLKLIDYFDRYFEIQYDLMRAITNFKIRLNGLHNYTKLQLEDDLIQSLDMMDKINEVYDFLIGEIAKNIRYLADIVNFINSIQQHLSIRPSPII